MLPIACYLLPMCKQYGSVRYGTVRCGTVRYGTVPACTYVQIVRYVQYVQIVRYVQLGQNVQHVRMYVHMLLVPSTWYLVCIHKHPYAFIICIRHTSVCIHMPPYVSITHPNVNMQRIFLQICQKVDM